MSDAAKQNLSPEEDPSSIGNLAIEKKYITRQDLDDAVKIQNRKAYLGEILLAMGKLTQVQLDELLTDQKIRRGEITDPDEIRLFERSRMKRRLCEFKKVFSDAGENSQVMASELLLMAKANGG